MLMHLEIMEIMKRQSFKNYDNINIIMRDMESKMNIPYII